MSVRLVEMNMAIQLGRACGVECFVGVGEEFEVCMLVYREPVEFHKVWCDVGSAWEVEN